MVKVIARQNEGIETLIRRYRRVRAKSGLSAELRKREAFLKPGERKRMKHAEALRRKERSRHRVRHSANQA